MMAFGGSVLCMVGSFIDPYLFILNFFSKHMYIQVCINKHTYTHKSYIYIGLYTYMIYVGPNRRSLMSKRMAK